MYNIIDLDEAKRKYPHLDCSSCDDPRHREGDDDEPVAVVVTRYDIYPVCEACFAAIAQAR